MNSTNKYIDDEKGIGASDLPNSSAITHSSNIPRPSPPYSSGIDVAVQPIAETSLHSSFE